MKRLLLLNAIANSKEVTDFANRLAATASIECIQSGESIAYNSDESSSSTIILADARLTSYPEEVLACISNNEPEVCELFGIQYSDNTADFNSFCADQLVSELTQVGDLPALMIQVNTSLLQQTDLVTADDAGETIMRCAIAAIANHTELSMGQTALDFSKCTDAPRCDLSDSVRARLLSLAVSSINIEDLFPNHAWQKHEEEVAAACFHTLAGHFIRYGDLQAAEDCLSFSDRLEDSPRSLALRGLISRRNGETLGAVANLVSSLQQYESRKRNDGEEHYVTFMPSDLEVINTSLNNGLSALNKQDNDTAFSHFAKAVYNFDSFYSQIGLKSFD